MKNEKVITVVIICQTIINAIIYYYVSNKIHNNIIDIFMVISFVTTFVFEYQAITKLSKVSRCYVDLTSVLDKIKKIVSKKEEIPILSFYYKNELDNKALIDDYVICVIKEKINSEVTE